MVLGHDVKDEQRTLDIQISVDVTFSSMLLSNNTLEGLNNSGFYKPSPIQLHGIPLGKCGFDLILEAKSGTGKTAVFTVITLEQIDLDKGLQSVILAPTREIAAQVRDVIKQIGSSYQGLNVEVVIGGLPVEEDIEKFQKDVHVLVGSPGRMRSLIQNKYIDVSAVRLLVLDEADKLIDKSFQSDINYIYSALPKQKQVILSSATYPEISIIKNYVKKAQHICPDSTSILLGIKQFITIVESNVNVVRQTKNKFEELLKILTKQEFKQCLIFCNYQVRVVELCKMLKREKWPAEQLHGQLEQTNRLDALRTLQEYKCRILVSTDLAARGIDASNVDLVINFEAPFEWQTYLHRIGRAGRFGSFGIAITVLSKGQESLKFKENMKLIGSSLNIHNLWDDDKFEIDNSNFNNTSMKDDKLKTSQEIPITKADVICDPLQMEKTDIKPEVAKVEISSVELGVSKCKLEKIEDIGLPQKDDTITTEIIKLKDQPKRSQIDIDEEQSLKDICNQIKNKNLSTASEESVSKELLGLSKCEQLSSSEGCSNQAFSNKFQSMEKAQCKLESFDDLMTSFTEYKPDNNESIDILETLFTTNLDSELDIEIDPNIILDMNSDTDIEFEPKILGNSQDKKKTYLEDRIHINNVENVNCGNSKSESVASKSCSQHVDPISQSRVNNNLLQNQVESLDSSSHKALIKAGLPIAFGSNKYKNKNVENEVKSRNDYGNLRNKLKANVIRRKDTDDGYKSQIIKSNSRESNVFSSTEASTSFNDDYNTNSGLLSRSNKYLPSQNNKKCHNKYIVPKVGNEMTDDNIEPSSCNYKRYKTWYKQLKAHIQQIEMTLYIDEVSKI